METPAEAKNPVSLPSLPNSDSPAEPLTMLGLPSDHNGGKEFYGRQRYNEPSRRSIATQPDHEVVNSAVPDPLCQRFIGSSEGESSHNPAWKIAGLPGPRERGDRRQEDRLQSQLIPKLIDIFEAAGIKCVQGSEKELPWTNIDEELLRIDCYVAGWPDICLPVKATRFPNQISPSSHPEYWWLKQWLALEVQINKGAVKVLPRPEGRAVLFETVDSIGNIRDSTIEYSSKWVHANLLVPRPIPGHSINEEHNIGEKESVKVSSLFGRVKKRVMRFWKRGKQLESKSTPSALPHVSNARTHVAGEWEGSGSGSGEMHFSESRSSFGSTASEAARTPASPSKRPSRIASPIIPATPTTPTDPTTSPNGSLHSSPRAPCPRRLSTVTIDRPNPSTSTHTPIHSSTLSRQQSRSRSVVKVPQAPGSQGSQAFNRDLDKLCGVLPHVPKDTLAIYLSRAEGRSMMAVGRYLEDERQGTVLRQ